MVARRLAAIVGPTASGKSALALDLALRSGGEIVSCDSLQVYRGLDIGSAKATAREQALVPHHMIDVVDPDATFSAADYARGARAALEEIAGRGRPALVVGGTGLYLRALMEGLFPGPGRDAGLRLRLERLAERAGPVRLHRLLQRVDPSAAKRIQVRDRVRLIRALEVYFLTGRPLSEQHGRDERPLTGFEVLLVGLAPERADLRRRVERRTDEMLRQGLIEETRGLLDRGYRDCRPLRSIGYRQAVDVIEGRLALGTCAGAVVQETMRYAKRQMTWFRHQARVTWLGAPDEARESVLRWLSGEEAGRV
jgi:tRNA dimethylallyltransferase